MIINEVTPLTFDEAMERVMQEKSVFFVPLYGRVIVIPKWSIEGWRKTGKEVIKISADGKGFRLLTGKKSVYLFSHQLKEQITIHEPMEELTK